MSVITEVMVANGSEARPFTWGHLSLERLIPNLTAGLIVGILVIISSVSYTALIFAGELAPHLSVGIGVALIGAIVLSAVMALTSSFPAVSAQPQDNPAVILALIAASLTGQLQARGLPSAILPTVIALLGVASLATGIFFLLLGLFGLSKFVRFIPYPVIGGFLTGTGWLIAKGAMEVMADVSLHPDTLSALFQGALLVRWVPGVLYAGALLVAARRCHHYLTMPALLVAATGLFYLGLWLAGTSIVQARAQGLLLGPFPSSGLWPPLRLADLAQVNWTVLAGQSAPLLALVLVSTVSLLLNAAGVELATSRDMDVDRELLATGVANSVAGLGGGLPGYISLGKSMISHKIGADNRLVGLSSALVCGGTLFFGASVLSYLPRPIMGGLLLYTGLDMLIEWVVVARRKLPAVDYVLVLLILGVIATIGFLQGVGAGDRSPPGYRGHCQANGVFRTTLQAGRRSVGLPGGPLRRISIHRDTPGHVELTGTAPKGAPLRQEATLGVEIAGEPRSSSRLPARRQVRS